MRKLKGNIWVKFAALILAVIFGSVAAFCGLATLLFGLDMELRESEAYMEQQMDKSLLTTYAAVLLDNLVFYKDGTVGKTDGLDGGNIRYTLICKELAEDGQELAADRIYTNDPAVDEDNCLVTLSSDRHHSYDANSFLDALKGVRSYGYYRFPDETGTYMRDEAGSYTEDVTGEEGAKTYKRYVVCLSVGRLWNQTKDIVLPEAQPLQCGVKDYTVDAARLAGRICDFRRTSGWWLAASGILFLICFVFLMCVSGHRMEDGDIHLRQIDRMPFGVYFGFWGLLEWAAAGMIVFVAIEGIEYGWISVGLAMGLLALFSVLGILAALIFSMGVAVRIKAKKFWRYTVLYYIVKPLIALWRMAKNELPLVVKGLVLISIVSLTELWVLGEAWYYDRDAILFFFLLYKLVEFPAFIYVLCQMSTLKKGGVRIAGGDYSQPIDTRHMFGEFKRHGENLNSVSSGISLAVEERTKSERFRTELITNVSHDIKTPLTSIINYVDLMKKEEISDETLLEYMAVLDRQSARLKKLIEDLMEASKASTGNLPVELAVCDTAVMLSQVVGEFEDRAKANGLELIVTEPETPACIMADGRHLWRILDNLMSNICKYAMPGTRVYIDLEVFHGMVIMTFRNISVERLNISSAELMERFVRGDSSRNTEGSGLGLSIAQNLAALMNGNMAIQIDGDLFKAIVSFEEIKN